MKTCPKCRCEIGDMDECCPGCLDSVRSLISAIEGAYAGMSHADLVLTCDMLNRGREIWRKEAEHLEATVNDLRERLNRGSCTLATYGRGDCEHFVGLPGLVIEGQHDGPPTEDHYGKPNGWCWPCWWSYRTHKAEQIAKATGGQP